MQMCVHVWVRVCREQKRTEKGGPKFNFWFLQGESFGNWNNLVKRGKKPNKPTQQRQDQKNPLRGKGKGASLRQPLLCHRHFPKAKGNKGKLSLPLTGDSTSAQGLLQPGRESSSGSGCSFILTPLPGVPPSLLLVVGELLSAAPHPCITAAVCSYLPTGRIKLQQGFPFAAHPAQRCKLPWYAAMEDEGLGASEGSTTCAAASLLIGVQQDKGSWAALLHPPSFLKDHGSCSWVIWCISCLPWSPRLPWGSIGSRAALAGSLSPALHYPLSLARLWPTTSGRLGLCTVLSCTASWPSLCPELAGRRHFWERARNWVLTVPRGQDR